MTMLFKTRESLPSDYTAIAALLRQLGYETPSVLVLEKIETFRHSPTDKLLVATVEGKVVGSISLHASPLFHADGYVGRVTSLVVDERHRACGIGSALIAAANSWFKRVGCVKSEVTSVDDRPDAHRFFESHSFLRDGQRLSKQL